MSEIVYFSGFTKEQIENGHVSKNIPKCTSSPIIPTQCKYGTRIGKNIIDLKL